MIDVLLAHAHAELEGALGRLRQQPESMKPFLIVEELGQEQRKRFVQFAGSTERGLLFDVPSLGISYHLPDPDNFVAAARLALETLSDRLGVSKAASVRITESASPDPVPN